MNGAAFGRDMRNRNVGWAGGDRCERLCIARRDRRYKRASFSARESSRRSPPLSHIAAKGEKLASFFSVAVLGRRDAPRSVPAYP